MSSAPKTTRDQLTLLVDLMRRTTRHLWLVGLLAVIGAGLSTMLAMKQTPQYDSETVLLYQEKISQSVLQGREVARNSRTMSARFKEMLLSRTSMGIIVEEFNLYQDVVERDGTVAAAEKLRMLVTFTSRGAGTYKISYRGNTAEEAQKITARLASLLLERDERVRRSQAEQTQKFLENEKVRAENTLLEAEAAFASFVSKHPEFVTDMDGGGAGGGVGSAIRAKEASDAQESKRSSSSGGSRIGALKRAAKRLRDRIANPTAPIAPVIRKVRRTDSPALQEARRELADSKRNLADKTARFTPKHPDVKAAQNGVNELTRRLRKVEAEEAKRQPVAPLTSPTITASTSMSDLKEELARIDSEISRLKSKSRDSEEPEDQESTTIVDDLVGLETQHAKLLRRTSVAGQRLASLEGRAFTAEITASAEFAEAAQLVIIEKAYLPARAAGKGKKIVVMAGTVVFGLLGGVIALGLALIDDRIYRRADIDELGIAPVLVVIPKATKKKRWKRGQKTKSSKA